ncbi:Wd tetratricopeptide repeat domain-containing protein [Stagonosporopsis vannaccii]|nr:Wd tetratricopeptide repeat domain-containing protein [Stagonosporopsis vannaccii]
MEARILPASELVGLQQRTPEQPYSIVHRLNLAMAYKSLGYPDLAIGDAYKALLLVDEVAEEGEYHDEALEAANTDYLSERATKLSLSPAGIAPNEGVDDMITWVQNCLSRTAHDLLIEALLACGCFRSAFDYIARATRAFPDHDTFRRYDEALTSILQALYEKDGENVDDIEVDNYPDKGLVRRENYPWNEYEPDRHSKQCLQFLNDEMANIAPRLEVRVSELPLLTTEPSSEKPANEVKFVKQLGVFAKEDIAPGEEVLNEKSLLTAVSRLHDVYCDACSTTLPESGADKNILSCDECDEVFFCSEECHDLAQDTYHPSICGVSVDQGKVPAREAADSLYSILLVRALALAETQDLHPLELKELRYIWGDYHGTDLDTAWQNCCDGEHVDAFAGAPRTLPFSFNNNIIKPLHLLEKMDVNIFTQSFRYDTWVFNTIYAKLRGTASAQQGLDGRPEIGAVHPMWCLANHSCDPNVAWEWQGTMKFWTREKLVDWKGRDPSKGPGLKKGEEVFGHYCDVRLPVKERREWAVGALGGDCMCPRCVWEEAEQRRLEIPA